MGAAKVASENEAIGVLGRESIKLGKPQGAAFGQCRRQCRRGELGLVGEMGVKAAVGEPGRGHDLGDPGTLEPGGPEAAASRRNDPLPRLRLALGTLGMSASGKAFGHGRL